METKMKPEINWTFDIYLVDPTKLIMGEANHTSLNHDWDTIIQVVAKTQEEAKKLIPEEYKDWYITRVKNTNLDL